MRKKKLQLYIIFCVLYSNCSIAAETQLADVHIQGNEKLHKKSTELTGLGKEVKNSKDLDKEIVMDIRDLTRYDPGIDVVEQGRGASSGYSIRGMDKNRVGISVDGIPQLSHYTVERFGKYAANDIFSGAINEIEYENIKNIEISKGASSSDFGSGSLGGSIRMQTKDAQDIIKSGKNWGLDVKSAYSSKNSNLLNSIAFAGRHKNTDYLLIHTQKDGEETEVHGDVLDESFDVAHSQYYFAGLEYDKEGNETGKDNTKYFVIQDENGNQSEEFIDAQFFPSNFTRKKIKLDQPEHLKTDGFLKWYHVCDPQSKDCIGDRLKNKVHAYEATPQQLGWPYLIYEKEDSSPYAYEQIFDKDLTTLETISAENYTGKDSPTPDKLNYNSNSTLAKFGYHFNDNQRIGIVYENTKQEYNIRDMHKPAYWKPDEEFKKLVGRRGKGNYIAHSTNPAHNLILPLSDPISLARAETDPNVRINDPTNPVIKVYDSDKKDYVDHFLYVNKNTLKDGKRIPYYKTEVVDGVEKLVAVDYYWNEKLIDIVPEKPIILEEGFKPKEVGLISSDVHGTNYRYTRLRHIDELHNKERAGLTLQQKDLKFFDDVNFTYDLQRINTKTTEHIRNCSEYPTIDKNCRATMDKPYSYYETQTHDYDEQHHIFKADANTKFNTGSWKHRLNMLAGYDLATAKVQRTNYYAENAVVRMEKIGGKGTKDNPSIFVVDKASTGLYTTNNCSNDTSASVGCNSYNLTSKNTFIGFNDKIKINPYLDLGLGLRYDHHKVETDSGSINADYNNLSYNVGAVIKPTKNIFLSYRMSNGFRVPTFHEQFGYEEVRKFPYESRKLSPETVINQEYGLGVKGNYGLLEMNYFNNKYKDLIIVGRYAGFDSKDEEAKINYRNLENATLDGINIHGHLDLNSVYNKVPDGLYSTFHYNKLKVKDRYLNTHDKKVEIDGKIYDAQLEILGSSFEAIQPAKLTFGLGYDSPDDKWGLQAMMVHSKAKKYSEILSSRNTSRDCVGESKNGLCLSGEFKEPEIPVVYDIPKPWTTYDLIGYYKPTDHITIRAGIFNIFNKRYTTWSALRQVSENSIHKPEGDNYNYLTAPGRNFSLAAEFKF